jgi:ribosomal protein S11
VYSSSNTSVATIDASGNFITLVGAGDVSFNATQAQTNQYNSATKTSNTLTVARGTSTLASSTFTVSSSKTILDASFTITTRPTSNSSGAITYSSNNTSVATIDASGNFITIVGLGTVTFTATQAQTSQYVSATKTSNTLTVSKAMPTLAFVSPPTTKNVTDAAFTVTANSASSGAVTYSSSNTSFATVNPSTGLVTLKGVGTVTITASQASTATYEAPTNATCSIVIASAGTALQGQTVSSSTSYASVDLSGASFLAYRFQVQI